MNTHQRIIKAGEEAFFRYGVRSVTLDDLASAIGISKKTIYQHFKNKRELVYAVAEHRLIVDQETARSAFEHSTNAIDELLVSSQMMRKMYADVNPLLLADLKKYYPKAWKLHESGKATFEKIIEENIKRGIADGLFRADTNYTILAKMRMECIEIAFNPEVFPPSQFSFIPTQECMLDHFLRGIVTPKGLNYYEEVMKNNPELISIKHK